MTPFTGTTFRNRAHRGHRTNLPGPIRSLPNCCKGNRDVLNTCPSAQRTTVTLSKAACNASLSLLRMTTATLGEDTDTTPAATPAYPTGPTCGKLTPANSHHGCSRRA